MVVPALPECDPTAFAEVLEIPVASLDLAPGRQQIHVDLVAAGSTPPAVGFGERPRKRWWLEDGSPSIVVSLYEFPPFERTDSIT